MIGSVRESCAGESGETMNLKCDDAAREGEDESERSSERPMTNRAWPYKHD